MSSLRILRHLYTSSRILQQVKLIQTTKSCRSPYLLNNNCYVVTVLPIRCYAKKKGKKHTSKIDVSRSADDDILDLQDVKYKMQTVLDHLKEDYVKQVTVRTSPGALDHILVSTSDGKIPLNQLGQISMKSSQKFTINMISSPQEVNAAMKAIQNSGMNLNPSCDGTIINVPIPKVTKEHRESLAKNAKGMCDKTKVNLRNVRSKVMADIKKHKDHSSKDTLRLLEKQVQQITDEFNENAEHLLSAKTKELLGH
ncbi:ribosome-recycling factor, mitochondrial-like [Glandiceps talaboti]